MVTIGNVCIEDPVALGPMAGVTDLPFRLICKEMGCGLLYTEMVSAKALHYKNENTNRLMETLAKERPIALQLFGSDPEILAEQTAAAADLPFDIIDLNMGCPVPKVVNNNEGSALLKQPELVRQILISMVAASKKPVTIKIRRGFTLEEELAVDIAKIAQDCGVSAVAVHGRTRSQYYSGEADLGVIKRVKQAVSIPVIGNGDITSAEKALHMIKETGCDMVMVARGALGNPWIFREISAAVKGEAIPPRPEKEEIRQMMLHHTELMRQYKGDHIALLEMRKHVSWYTSGMHGGAAFRRRVNATETMEELLELIYNFGLEN
jgi:nifR3 family TIM-barrel protein